MHLPTFAKPVLTRASRIERAHAAGVMPQMRVMYLSRGNNCGPAWQSCGIDGPENEWGLRRVNCCNRANEICHEGRCLERAVVRELNNVGMPYGVAETIASYT